MCVYLALLPHLPSEQIARQRRRRPCPPPCLSGAHGQLNMQLGRRLAPHSLRPTLVTMRHLLATVPPPAAHFCVTVISDGFDEAGMASCPDMGSWAPAGGRGVRYPRGTLIFRGRGGEARHPCACSCTTRNSRRTDGRAPDVGEWCLLL